MANFPMDVVASKNWKINIPLRGAPEIVQPKLATYSSEWFHLNEAGDGVVFYCPTNGGTTPNSKNPRSELREMRDDGADEAEWSTSTGQHSMIIDLMVTELPAGTKPHVVIGQIHGGDDDLTVFRLEGNTSGDRNVGKLWITSGDNTHAHHAADIRLGTRHQLGFHVDNGTISYSYNGFAIPYKQTNKKKSSCYFKVGAYNQAGGVGDPNGYAEVVLYSVQVCHNGVCEGRPPGVIIVPGEPPVEPPTTPDLAELRQQMNSLTLRIAATEQDLARLRAGLGAAALEK